MFFRTGGKKAFLILNGLQNARAIAEYLITIRPMTVMNSDNGFEFRETLRTPWTLIVGNA
jgi:hypothetical protein